MTDVPRWKRIPQVLTRAKISTLTQDLDAGDVLECYLLTRKVYLDRMANSTIAVSKQALGIRYRPPPNSIKRPLEITLEYGPMRSASQSSPESDYLMHDVVPRLNEETVSWENDAQVYVTRSITAEIYEDANYVSSLSGAVLPHLLEQACVYVTGAKTRRYQPFSIASRTEDGEHSLLTSSSDTDFCQFALETLASVGVVLSPVIPPAPAHVQLTATKVRRIAALEHAREIHTFYKHLYTCVENIASATVMNSPTSPDTNTMAPTQAPSRARRRLDDGIQTSPQPVSINDLSMLGDGNEATSSPSSDEEDRLPLPAQDNIGEGEPDLSNLTQTSPPTQTPSISSSPPEASPTSAPSLSPRPSTATEPTENPVTKTEEAQKAAEEAQEAADAASQAGNKQAADAASQAADAAQKAADVTAAQAAQVMQNSLLYGDGPTMASVLSKCLSDPVFGLSSNRNRTLQHGDNITAYLYWDGHFFFEADLVPPYVKVVPYQLHLPAPRTRLAASDMPADTFVDWALFLLILVMSLLGILLLAQAVLGRNFGIIPSLYKFQRWFFHPLEHDYSDLDDRSQADIMMETSPELDTEYDVIPLSMRGSSNSPITRPQRAVLTQYPRQSFSETDGSNASLEVEMAELHGDNGLLRSPDLVPDLTSRSKVAVPVSLTPSGAERKSFNGDIS